MSDYADNRMTAGTPKNNASGSTIDFDEDNIGGRQKTMNIGGKLEETKG